MPTHRIALFIHDRLNDYQNLLQVDCEQSARQYDMVVTSYSANRDVETQVKQIRTAIDSQDRVRPEAILVSAVREIALVPLMQEAASRGIGWVMLSRTLDAMTDARRKHPHVPLFAVIPDHVEVGHIQGQQVRAIANYSDELVYIQGPVGTFSTKRRHQGIERELADRPDLQWSKMNSDWTQEGGEDAMRGWLRTFTHRKLPSFIVAAQNDAMAAGARQALLDFGISGGAVDQNSIRILGCDGTPTFGQRLVSAGQLKATVVIPSVAGRAVEELAACFRSKRSLSSELLIKVQSFPEVDALRYDAKATAPQKPRSPKNP